MIKKVKIWVIALLCFSLVIISSVAVYAGTASYSAIVPRLGGNWYSASMPATGPNQSNYCSYTAAYDGNIWGNIVDSNSKEMANRQPIHEGYETYYRSNASVGQAIRFFMTSEFWVPVNVRVDGSGVRQPIDKQKAASRMGHGIQGIRFQRRVTRRFVCLRDLWRRDGAVL